MVAVHDIDSNFHNHPTGYFAEYPYAAVNSGYQSCSTELDFVVSDTALCLSCLRITEGV